jgi:hypothetical protein
MARRKRIFSRPFPIRVIRGSNSKGFHRLLKFTRTISTQFANIFQKLSPRLSPHKPQAGVGFLALMKSRKRREKPESAMVAY